ncbi:MAG: carboxypeptidase regulatory-like domain-containing protein [Longimicrobiales bacterium]
MGRRPLFFALLVATAIPGAATAQDPGRIGAALEAACGVRLDPAREAVLAGIVTDSVSGVPLAGARVVARWQVPGDSIPDSAEVESDTRGFFAFCKVPAPVHMTLHAVLRVVSAPQELDTEAGMLHLAPIRLRLSDPDSKGVLQGRVADATVRSPVPNAIVRLVELDRTTLTNSRGYFSFGGQPWGLYTLEIEGLGYARLTTAVRVAGNLTQTVEILLSPDALELEGMTITGTAQAGYQIDGLIRRMSLGGGSFITRETIERRPAARVADLLREVPGVSVRRGSYGRIDLEVRGRTCNPDVFVDGVPYVVDPALGLDFYAGELEAVEVYKGVEVPGEFLMLGHTTYPCAVVVIWTRKFR